MTSFFSLLSIIITLFLLMVVGFWCRHRGIIDTVASKRLSTLIIQVGQPMMIIGALNGASYSGEHLRIALITTVIGFCMHAFMAFAAYLICKKHNNGDRMKIFEFGLIFANCGFIGFPIMDSIYGSSIGSFMGAFYVISFHLFLWTWGIVILARGRSDIRLTVKKAFLNYGTVPCAIGIVLYLCKPLFTLPAAIGSFLSYLGGLCTPISVLITGALLATVSIPAMLKNRTLYLHSFIKLILFPIVICLVAKLIGLGDRYVLLCTVMAGLPSASSIVMLSELYDIEPAYASETVGLSSLLVTFTLPLMLLFAQAIIAI